MAREKPHIFISHIHEDAEIAKGLKQFLDEAFLGFFEIFVASDGASIKMGDNWAASIESALHKAELVLIILSEASLERRWIYFEAGGAYFMKKRVIPVCCREMSIGQLGKPLNWLQSLESKDSTAAVRLIHAIATTFEINPPNADLDKLVKILEGSITRSVISAQVSEKRLDALPLFILLDTSGSMVGERINLMREGLIKLVDYLQAPEMDVLPLLSILTYGDDCKLLLPPTPVNEVKGIPPIMAGGSSALGAALRYLASVLSDPYRLPKNHIRPLIIITIDGEPTDDWRSGLNALKSTVGGGHANRLCLALGDGADYRVLREIGNIGVLPMIQPEDFLGITKFFQWVSAAVNVMEHKEELVLPPPPPEIHIVP